MLIPLLYYWLRYDEFLALFDSIDSCLSRYDLEELQLAKLHTQINDARDRMRSRKVLRWSSQYTKDVVTAHKQRGEAWLCLYHHLKARTYCQDMDLRQRAKSLLMELNASRIKVYVMGYSDLSAKITNMIQKVESNQTLQEELKVFDAWSFYESLKLINQQFLHLLKARSEERTNRPNIKGKEVAQKCTELYKELEQTLVVLNKLTGKKEYDTIAKEINVSIKKLNNIIKTRKAKSGNSKNKVLNG